MAILTTGNSYSDGNQITSSNLNAVVNSATFADPVDTSSGLNLTSDSPPKIAINTALSNKVLTGGSLNNCPIGAVTPGTGAFSTLSASGVVSVPDGSESAPAITNTGDTNTGIYFPTENSIALTAGAGARLTCSTSAITIERPTTVVSTAQCELTLQGGDANSKNLIFKKASAQQGKITAVGDELKFYAGTSGTESLEITTTGVVIPGTISVTGLIKQSGDTGFLDIQGGDTAGANIELYGASHASHANDAFYDADSHSFRPANGSSTNVIINSSGNVGIGTATPEHSLSIFKDANAARTEIGIDNTDQRLILGSFYESGGLQYATIQSTNNAETGAQALVLQPDGGNVGIGDNDPSKELVVKNIATAGTESIVNIISGNTGVAGIYLGDSDDDIVGGIVYDNSADTLQLRSSNNQTAVTIDSSERVGIGASPSYKLDVNGTGRFVNNLTLDENLVHNLTGAGSLPGYSAGTFGAVLEDGGANGSTLYMSRKNSWALYLATDTTLNAQSDKVVQFADLNGQSGDQDNVTGSITITASATAFNTSSDYRLKENEVDITDGIDRLKELKPYRFNFTRDPSTTVDGFFAHEVSPVVPESINGEKDAVDEEGRPDYQGIDQSKLVPLLTAALQEAVAKIEALEARVQTLEG